MAGESITFSFGADTAGLTSALDGLLGKLAGLAAAFLSAQAVVQAFGEAIDLGGRLNDLSARTGETAGNLALLERAFENTSVGADKVGPAIARMQVSITDFAQGTDKAVAAFAQLGLSLEDLQQHSPTEQMEIIGQRLAAIYDPALRAATAMDIFGRSGAELLPVLMNFSSEMAEASGQLGSLPEMLDRTAAEIDSLGDNLAAIRNKGIEMAYGFLSEVVPAVDMLAQKLAGLDAAGIGAGLADALVGAFVSPMKAAELLGETLLYGVKLMGNEMVYQIRYWTELLANAFGALGRDAIPLLGKALLGELEIAAGTFGELLLGAISDALEGLRPIAESFGLGDQLNTALSTITDLQQRASDITVDGFQKITEFGERFGEALYSAEKSSTVVKEDIFGAQNAATDIAEKFAGLQEDARAAVEEFSALDTAEGRTTTGTGVDPLMNILINENKVTQTAISTGGAGTTTRTQTQAQAFAEAMKALGLVAEADVGTAVGRSASAQKALDLQKQIASLSALGTDPARLQRLGDSLRSNLDIALGAGVTAADREAASQWARENINNPLFEGETFTSLEQMALADIQTRKEDAAGITDLMKKSLGDKMAEQTKKAGEQPQQQKAANTLLGIAQELLKLMQKVEPRIPVGNLV